ncbi:hypothetical protein RirG_114510 [Rhizophagus irregularis DAOM 197198w]|uniref:Uncharacterized protein n=1 Tax=Rhizophagus irregularis (strain DAOM 197198w) TaxID=1432141 RepID=A0A015JJT3_RHIIW|nr:hypothetical protein RirG_114510 [Rhizophagus irregularis DAOM 197198w]
MIPSRWYIDNQKDKDAAAETCCFVNTEAAQNFSGVVFTPNPSTVPTTVTNALRCAAKKKVKYGEVWDLRDRQLNFLLNLTVIMKWLVG